MEVLPDTVVSAFGENKTLKNWVDDIRCRANASEVVFRLRQNWSAEKALSAAGTRGRTSLFRYVTWNAQRKTWLARYYDGERIKHLGSFRGKSGEILAALAYDAAARADENLEDPELNFPGLPQRF